MIVGVPYAKPTLRIKRLIGYYDDMFGKGKGRLYSYIVPALWSALQAAGRGIRSERDVCQIIFLDSRFMTNARRLIPTWMLENMKFISIEWLDSVLNK